jgi:hypothetical protein
MIWHMSADEIRQLYRRGRKPSEQLRIIAELNCCSVEDVKIRLIEIGEPIRTHKPHGLRLMDSEVYRDYAELNRRRRQ